MSLVFLQVGFSLLLLQILGKLVQEVECVEVVSARDAARQEKGDEKGLKAGFKATSGAATHFGIPLMQPARSLVM